MSSDEATDGVGSVAFIVHTSDRVDIGNINLKK